MTKDHDIECRMYIDGRSAAGDAGVFDVFNPATGQVLGQAHSASVAQVDAAVRAARRAQPAWEALTDDDRRAHLVRAARTLEGNLDHLARLITLEQGKPLAGPGSVFEVQSSAQWTRAAADIELHPEVVFEDAVRRDVLHRRALGVVAAVAPWNWPLLIAIWQVMPALRMGNTVVLKPSEFTPLATLEAVRLIGSDLPAGVLNVVTGDGAVGQALVSHPDVAKIQFTGSENTGRRVVQASAGNLARLTLELGGNDAAVVLEDVDVAAVAMDLFWGAFLNLGQTCACAKRLYVPRSREREIVEALVAIARDMPIGNGLEPGIMMGPIQNPRQHAKVRALIEDARSQGATVHSGASIPVDGRGNFQALSVVTGIGDGIRLVDEEQFGPVLPVIAYDDVDNAIERANRLPLGLGASVWSSDPERAVALAGRLEAGTVWINQHGAIHPMVPFGGSKGSGYGSEFGVEGLKAVSAARVISLKKSYAARQ